MKKIKGYNIVKEKTNELLVSIEIGNDEVIEKDGYRVIPFYEEGNPTIEQNTGENRVEGGVLSVSGIINDKCYKCGKQLTLENVANIVLTSNPPKFMCKECAGEKEKHYRPFNNCDELVETYHNRAFIPIVAEGLTQKLKRMYRPEIWVKEKETGIEQLITGFGDTVVKFSPDYTITLKSLFENYMFLDSSPCGMEE